MIYRLVLAKWAHSTDQRQVIERELSREELEHYNGQGYNCYYLPNHPSKPVRGRAIHGRDVDVWNYVFADMDLKDGVWPTKQAFIDEVNKFALKPSAIVDSGNGVHVYWSVSDLDPMSYLRLQRRICRRFKTDEAVANMYQLMRVPNTVNVKNEDPELWKLCEVVQSDPVTYDCQTLDKALPKISVEDESFCKEHHEKTMRDPSQLAPRDAAKLPSKWFKFIKENLEAKKLFNYENVKDRSTADYRLAHLLLANGFTRNEARAVLMNTGKAIERTSIHQYNYAQGMVEKLWEGDEEEAEETPASDGTPAGEKKPRKSLSRSVTEILKRSKDAPRNTRFPCHPAIDATTKGYRLGEVLGLVGGAGAGKTTFCLNMFKWFWERNPDYIHIFVSLEQPEDEIAERWARMAGDDPALHQQVRIIGNYNDDGTFRNLGFKEIEAEVRAIQKQAGQKVGCVVVDHIAILRYERDTKEMKEKLSGLCEQMKVFAVRTNTFLIMQSQTSRQKAGNGDVELDKDAAYGTGYFEFYADYVVTTWQPLKRLYGDDGFADRGMYVNCWKYCKIRNKKANQDRVQEDQVYAFKLDIDSDSLRPLVEDEYTAFEFLSKKATMIRNRDKKTSPAPLKVITWADPVKEPKE